MNTRQNVKTKRKFLRWLIPLIILAVLGIAGAAGWLAVNAEQTQAQNLPIADFDFSALKDGTYSGTYDGGMYGWRANEVQVTVTAGKVTDIRLLDSTDPARDNMDESVLYGRVVDAQSLQVDAVSEATLTSRAYLKAVENALEKARK